MPLCAGAPAWVFHLPMLHGRLFCDVQITGSNVHIGVCSIINRLAYKKTRRHLWAASSPSESPEPCLKPVSHIRNRSCRLTMFPSRLLHLGDGRNDVRSCRLTMSVVKRTAIFNTFIVSETQKGTAAGKSAVTESRVFEINKLLSIAN
jgi:hypothetical protein